MSSDGVRQAIETTSTLFRKEPGKAQVSTPPVTAVLEDGVAFRLDGARGPVRTDMPPPMGGAASAETPGWHMRAALAACIGTTIATRAAQLGVTLDTLEVTVFSEVDYRGMLGIGDAVAPGMTNLRSKVLIHSPDAPTDRLVEIVRWGEAHSPVACTIKAAHLSEAIVETGG